LKINDVLKNKIKKMELSDGFKKYFMNTGWLFFERIISMAVSFFVGVYVARYLAPANYGLYSYAASFVGLFAAITTLGLDSIIVRELVHDEKKRDELLGTSFVLKLIGSFLAIVIIIIAVRFTNNDNFTNLLIFINVIGTIFQSFNVIDFYFQSKVLSKYTVYAQVFSTIVGSIIKLLLIYYNMGLIYFTMVTLLQSIILASGLVVMYARQKSSLFKWRINFDLAKNLLKDSWPLMLSGIAISLYMKIDQVMIKNMLGNEAVGNYAVAVKLSEVWYFIPVVITSSVFPAIINAKKISEKLYYERLQQLYNLLVWLSIGIALPIMLLSNNIINILFGIQYQEAAGVLQIYVWAGVFVFFGCAWSKWIITENQQKIITLSHISGAFLNILLNYILIPIYGITGAAIASILSYFLSEFLGILLYKPYKSFILIGNIILLRKYNESK